MPAPSPLCLSHVRPLPVVGRLAGRRLVFCHIPKTAGTTLDWTLATIAETFGFNRFRAHGTVYGQFFGPGKEAADSLRQADDGTVAEADFLVGHVPVSAWDERVDPDGAVLVSTLRDPAERILSWYRFGIQRGAFAKGARLVDLARAGLIVDNVQVRMLAGCRDPREPCTEAMLAKAFGTLRERRCVIGTSNRFDHLLGTLIALFGWPEVVYSKMQVGAVELGATETAALRSEARALNRFDEELMAELRRAGPVWTNRLDPGPPPSRNDFVVVVSAALRTDDGRPIQMRSHELEPFKAALEAQGAYLDRKYR